MWQAIWQYAVPSASQKPPFETSSSRRADISTRRLERIMKRISRVFLPAIAAMVLSGSIFAAQCPEHITAPTWENAYKGGKQTQVEFLSILKACVSGKEGMQLEIDTLAVASLLSLPKADRGEQQPLVNFTMQALLINAQAGFPSSQHNYAAVHNADSSSLVRLFVPQDYPTFLYWTRQAAAQKEPRALFNLAVRMASNAPPEGVAQDLPTAYAILSYLERTPAGLPAPVVAYVGKIRGTIADQLGDTRVHQLNAHLDSFDFSVLAAAPVPAPSFSCDKAGTKVEKMVCSDSELSELDSDLAEAFGVAIRHASEKTQIRGAQKRWLNSVRNVCADKECVRRAYYARINQLQAETMRKPASDNQESQEGAIFEVRCDHSRGELVIAGRTTAHDISELAKTESYLVDPDRLTEYTGSDGASIHTSTGRAFYRCELGDSQYKVTIAPHIENANPNGECGAADTDISLTVRRNGTNIMSGIEFQHCRVGVNSGNTIEKVAISEKSGTVKITAIPEAIFLPIRYTKTYDLQAPPPNWMEAIFKGYPTGDANADLFIAVYKRDTNAIKQAIHRGANPNAKDLEGLPPIALLGTGRQDAYRKKKLDEFNRQSEEMATVLIAAGASGNAENIHGVTLLDYLLSTEVPDSIIELFLAHGANVQNGNPLAGAAFRGDEALLKKLLDMGADPNKKKRDGSTALWAAATTGFYSWSAWEPPPITEYAKCIHLLMQRGAKVQGAVGDSMGIGWMLVRSFGKDERLKMILAELVPYMNRDEIERTQKLAESYSPSLAQWLKDQLH